MKIRATHEDRKVDGIVREVGGTFDHPEGEALCANGYFEPAPEETKSAKTREPAA